MTNSPPCADCKAHVGTNIFSEGVMAYVHGQYQMLCDCCVMKRNEEALAKLTAFVAQLHEEKKPCRNL